MICYTTRLKITRISRTVSELKRESPKCLPEKTGYRLAQDAGLSIIETQFKSLKKLAESLVDEIIAKFEELTN